jgi:hypothetical protein
MDDFIQEDRKYVLMKTALIAALLMLGLSLAGCASGARKLPECKGAAHPINVPTTLREQS